MPSEVHRVIYFASIAAAIVRRGERISKLSPEVLGGIWQWLAAESYTGDWVQMLLGPRGNGFPTKTEKKKPEHRHYRKPEIPVRQS